MILMAFLAAVLPISTAMIVHGIVQSVANGSRFLLLYRHVVWRVLPVYAVGTGLAYASFFAIGQGTAKWVIFVGMGLLPFLPLKLMAKVSLSICRPWHAFLCGFVVMMLQLLAGASGPLLDMFFQDGLLNRHQIIATKAVTQSIGHLLKVVFYAALIGSDNFFVDNPAFIFLLVATALCGTKIGTVVLDKLKEEKFRFYFRLGIRIAGLACIGQGVRDLLVMSF